MSVPWVMTMPSTSGCLDQRRDALGQRQQVVVGQAFEATWNTCSPRTLATLASSGRPAISLSTADLGGRVGGAVDGRRRRLRRWCRRWPGSRHWATRPGRGPRRRRPAAPRKRARAAQAGRGDHGASFCGWEKSRAVIGIQERCPFRRPVHAETTSAMRRPATSVHRCRAVPSPPRRAWRRRSPAYRGNSCRHRPSPWTCRRPTGRCRGAPGANASWRRSAKRPSPSSACTGSRAPRPRPSRCAPASPSRSCTTTSPARKSSTKSC